MSEYQTLEDAANTIMEIYEVATPPVPIETILQKPRDNMWDELDVTQLSGSFLRLDHRYSPRMSLTRMLARHIAFSTWGKGKGLDAILSQDTQDEKWLRIFARMLVMPSVFLQDLTTSERSPNAMSLRFEVPDTDAQKRLEELANT